MPVLLEPYHKTRFLIFVVHPKIRLAAFVLCIVCLAVAVLRAIAESRPVWAVVGNGLWMLGAAYLLFPLWNRFIVYPWARHRPRKDRLGFLAFFEGFSLLAALLVMVAGALLGGDV